MIDRILSSGDLTVPVLRFSHPYPVTAFEMSTDALYVAMGGPYPTVIRWDLSQPEDPPAILFPARAEKITRLSVSPNGKHLIVHRGNTNLLCLAETLKPISALNDFPPNLDPTQLQPFTANSLLVATPSSSGNRLTWHIRDTGTGGELSSASIPTYPLPISAYFSENNLHVRLQNEGEIIISPLGEITHSKSQSPLPNSTPATPPVMHPEVDGNVVTLSRAIPASPNDNELLDALGGWQIDSESQELEPIPIPNRLSILHTRFPEIPSTLRIYSGETFVKKRLAAAFPESFPEISAPEIARAGVVAASFATKDPNVIQPAIETLPPSGLATSTALFLAYRSQNQKWIDAVIAKTDELPPALRNIKSRGPSAPDITDLRKTEDWIGFESPDFSPIFESLGTERTHQLTKLALPADPSDEQIKEFVTRLQDKDTLALLGAPAIADSAIRAAHGLATDSSHAATAIGLAAFSERYGASRSSSLRIRAAAHTTLGDFESAHRSWIDLITNQPEAEQLASDYSEAAYTAFETSAPEQAGEILDAGLSRFPDDVAFSIRASWIALITDHPGNAARYLKNATRIGLPADEVENITALLAITNTQLGESKAAQAYLAQLIAIDPAWGDADTIEKLSWPEPLKASLRQLTWEMPDPE